MLTNLRLALPAAELGEPGTIEQRVERLERERERLFDALTAHADRMNGIGGLQISEATVDATPIGATSASTGKFTTLEVTTSSVFPVASFTPALTFATPGDIAVTYATQQGRVIKLGEYRLAAWQLITNAFTHTTASGDLRITGLTEAPFLNSGIYVGALTWQGITKAGYSHVACQITDSVTYMNLMANGSGLPTSTVKAADMPTGGTVELRGSLFYRV